MYYGVREHGMAAAMNGMALHGGVIPYGGTFLVFTDYCRAAIRLSALQQTRAIYVMTHDSIGLGEIKRIFDRYNNTEDYHHHLALLQTTWMIEAIKSVTYEEQ